MQIFWYASSKIHHLSFAGQENRRAIEEIGMAEHQIAPDFLQILSQM